MFRCERLLYSLDGYSWFLLLALILLRRWNFCVAQTGLKLRAQEIICAGTIGTSLYPSIDGCFLFLEENCVCFWCKNLPRSSPHSGATLYTEISDFCGGFWCFVFLYFLRPKRTLYSKKYGVDLIRYTHAANTVVYSSNKIDGKQDFFLEGYGNGFLC